MNVRRARTFLVIEPDEACAASVERALAASGAMARLAGDAETGWRLFAAEPPDVVVTALTTPRRDGAWLLRRMRDEYLGTLPPVFAIVSDEEIATATRGLDVDGVLLRPVAAEALAMLATHAPATEEAPARHAARLRDLFELSLLSDDIDATLKTFVDRVALAFRTSDAVLWGPPHEDRWPRTRRPIERPEDQAMLLWRCDLALSCRAALIVADGATRHDGPVSEHAPARSFLAAPLDVPGARSVGALCLVDDGPRRFTHEERDALSLLARRIARELAWRSAHDRLAAEHDRLRETSLLDPLLGVWTRAALVEALAAEIARGQRTGDPVAVAVVDVEQLRQVNERHGHVAGDAVLVHIARLCRTALRSQDLIGRIGGDELGLALSGLGLREAHDLCDQLRRTIATTPVKHHGLDIQVRVRVGLTTVGPEELDGDPALARATLALGNAKKSRMNVYAVEPSVGAGAPSTTGAHEISPEDVSVPDILPAGTTLGGMYQILHEISRGAMGVVYRAEDLGLSRPVAVKVLRADLARDADLVSRFRDEAAMLAALHHENLVQVYAFGAQGDDVYFVMELVEGESLADLLQRNDEAGEVISIDLVGAVVAQVAGALSAMHRAGAVHRDVKPANVLLDRVRDRAVLVDVGVAKRRGARGDAAGTPGFAAPESFTAGDEGPSTDVYGLAATTYMLLTGLAPFGGGDVAKVVRRQLHDTPAAPSTLRAELASAVDRVLLRALSPQPRDRYPDALAFAHALGAALKEAPEAPLAGGSASPAQRPRDPSPLTTRRLARAIELAGVTPSPPETFGNTRGALFRVAYKILGNRLGSAWVRRACETNPGLAEVLRPTVAPLGWYPIERLNALLQAVPANVRDPRKVARELGRATMTATFARFLGADPSSLTPIEVLGAVGTFWSRYHSWGQVGVDVEPGRSVVRVADTPREPLICLLVEGSLERIAEMAGAEQAHATHVACESRGDQSCVFEVTWAAALAGSSTIPPPSPPPPA